MYPVAQDGLTGKVVEVLRIDGFITWVGWHYTSKWYYNDAMPPVVTEHVLSYPAPTHHLLWLN